MKFASLGLAVLMAGSIIGTASAQSAAKKPLTWSIKHTEWSKTHFDNYREFIAKLGEAREKGLCKTTDECLKHPVANPMYASKNPTNIKDIFADCADLPHILIAYFSWMNDLPFSYQSGISKARWRIDELNEELKELRGVLGGGGFFSRNRNQIKELEKKIKAEEERIAKEDIRYTTDGNSVRQRRAVRNGENVNTIFNEIVNNISTATYRIHGDKYDSGTNFKDMYHVSIDRRGIQPGTIVYDPAGHIAVVYKVTTDGRIFMIDAHPDNSLTRISFGEKFSRSPVIRGAGFVNFRPTKLVGARFDSASGTYQGGSIVPYTNSDLSNFSLEQFFGSNIDRNASLRTARFTISGTNYGFHEYVRRKLSTGALKINPVEELKNSLADLCLDLKDRKDSVDAAIDARIHLLDSPSKLPENIYGTHGTWETYSTPSRDARLKASIKEAHDNTKIYVAKLRAGNSEISYSGRNIKGDLLDVYEEVAKSCKIEVKGTKGKRHVLSLHDVIGSVFDLSFDPYHCTELRWGLNDRTSISECGQGQNKIDWYNAQTRLRNVIDRDYALRMDYTVRELPSAPIGESKVPQINILRMLEAL